MHHAKDGLYFERQVDGSVRVTFRADLRRRYWCEGDFEVILAPLTWASVVAAVSKRGQVMEVIEAALRLHEEALE